MCSWRYNFTTNNVFSLLTYQNCYFLGSGLNISRGSTGGGLSAMTTSSSSYVQHSQGSMSGHSRHETIEKLASHTSSSRANNYNIVDASRVRAQGDGLVRAYRNEKATFTVDTRDSGKKLLIIKK